MAALLSSCHIYKKYERPEVDANGLYRDPVSMTDTLVSDTANMANLPWEEVFTDPKLQDLIRTGLERNTNLQTALLQVSEARASLMTSRLSYLPSLNLTPQGGISSFVEYLNRKRDMTVLHPQVIHLKGQQGDIMAEVALQYNDSFNELLLSFANNSLLSLNRRSVMPPRE